VAQTIVYYTLGGGLNKYHSAAGDAPKRAPKPPHWAYQKDLANRDRVSYITLLAHRIQDRVPEGTQKVSISD